MALPKEPRQLMINLMYLVLTALLAMNVSSEILNAFKIIGKSISNSNKVVDQRNKAFLDNFQKYIDDPKTQEDKRIRVQEAQKIALEVDQKTSALVSELEKYKEMIVESAGGRDPQGNIKRIEDLDAASRVMVEQNNGDKMLSSLKNYKEELAGMVPLDMKSMTQPGKGNNPAFLATLPLDFSVDRTEENNGDWKIANFHMSPTIAAITLIDKYISDVRASQSMALDEIWSLATGEKKNRPFVTTKTLPDYAIIVAADNNFVLPGEKYRARIMMGTYNKKLKNLVFNVNGRSMVPVDGVVEYTEIANGTGQKNINVSAQFVDTILDANGEKKLQTIPVKLDKPATYYVGEAQASISLDKMNVLYVGLENPITVAASGIPANSITLTSENCTLTKSTGTGQYTVAVNKPGAIAKITMTGKLADGTTKNFGTYPYRVKLVPTPYPMVANSRSGKMSKNLLKAQAAVFAKLDDFAYELKFPVTSFTLTLQPKRGDLMETAVNGELLNSPSVRNIIDKVNIGDRVFFENIRCKAPDGIRSIGSVNFIITE